MTVASICCFLNICQRWSNIKKAYFLSLLNKWFIQLLPDYQRFYGSVYVYSISYWQKEKIKNRNKFKKKRTSKFIQWETFSTDTFSFYLLVVKSKWPDRKLRIKFKSFVNQFVLIAVFLCSFEEYLKIWNIQIANWI